MDNSQTLPTTPAPAARAALPDIARGIGILLVIYGHFLQSFFQPSAPFVAQQYQFIYSFHMPLFFVLSGLVGQFGAQTLAKTFRGGIELILLVCLMHLLGTGLDLLARDQTLDWSTPEIFRVGFTDGNPSVGVMWFLLCLGILRLTLGSALLIRRAMPRALAIILILALFAWAYSCRGQWPFWQDTTLLFGGLFFLFGRLVPLARLTQLAHPLGLLVTIPLTLTLAFYNKGCGFSFADCHDGAAHPIVMMMGAYNNYLLFVLGAVTGTLLCLAVARLLARTRGPSAALTAIGQQTLGLLLINALYCAFLLPLVQAHLPADGIDSLTLTAAALGLTLLQCLIYQVLKPATDSLTTLSQWLARVVTRA